MAEQAKKAVEEEVIKTYDYLAEDTKETGYEDMTNETMAIPWLKIIQKQHRNWTRTNLSTLRVLRKETWLTTLLRQIMGVCAKLCC